MIGPLAKLSLAGALFFGVGANLEAIECSSRYYVSSYCTQCYVYAPPSMTGLAAADHSEKSVFVVNQSGRLSLYTKGMPDGRGLTALEKLVTKH